MSYHDERRSFRNGDGYEDDGYGNDGYVNDGYGNGNDGYGDDGYGNGADGYGDNGSQYGGSYAGGDSQHGSEYGSQYGGYGDGRRGTRDNDDAVSDVSDNEWDDNGQHFVDDPAQEQPRFKYSTANIPTDSSARNTKCCLIAMCIICIIVAILVSVLFNKLSADSDPRTPTMAPSMAPVDTSVPGNGQFLASSDYVADQCGAEKWTNGDKSSCQITCDNFKNCCDPYLVPRNESCLLANQDKCLDYSDCHVVNNRIDPAPENLARVCEPEQVAVDDTLCQLSCKNVECCFTSHTETSCRAENVYACLAYSPCQNLRIVELEEINRDANVTDDRTLVPLADKGLIERACVLGEIDESESEASGVPNKDPQQECADACAPADCCFQNNAESCLNQNFFLCLEYRDCPSFQKFRIPFPGDRINLPPQNISRVCSEANFLANPINGTDECEEACHPGRCCLLEGGQNCFSVDPFSCLKYEPCRILSDLGGTINKNNSIIIAPPTEDSDDVNGTDTNSTLDSDDFDDMDGNSTIPEDGDTNSTDLDSGDMDDTNSTVPDDDLDDMGNSTDIDFDDASDTNSTDVDDDIDGMDTNSTDLENDPANDDDPTTNSTPQENLNADYDDKDTNSTVPDDDIEDGIKDGESDAPSLAPSAE